VRAVVFRSAPSLLRALSQSAHLKHKMQTCSRRLRVLHQYYRICRRGSKTSRRKDPPTIIQPDHRAETNRQEGTDHKAQTATCAGFTRDLAKTHASVSQAVSGGATNPNWKSSQLASSTSVTAMRQRVAHLVVPNTKKTDIAFSFCSELARRQ